MRFCPLILIYLLVAIATRIEYSSQLECYVCLNQEDNKGKCAETVKICDLEQDQCLAQVRWGSIPHWAITGQKQYYISKRCATKQECSLAMVDKDRKCDQVKYNDWNCTSCCSGDKCNYYVTLAANSPNNPNPLVALALCTVMYLFQRFISKSDLMLK